MNLLFLGDFFYDFPGIEEDIGRIAEEIRARGFRTVLNLEGVLCDPGGLKGVRKRGARLAQSEKCLEVLLQLNTVAVTLANNHTMDYGPEGLKDMLAALEGVGIRTLGAGNNITDAMKPLVLERDGSRLGLFNFGWDAEETVYAGASRPGCAPRDEKIILPAVSSFGEKEPELPAVVLMHWGYEYNPYPMPADILLSERLTALPNVRAVIGHHPHCVQPKTEINGKPVWFSLGNFYFSSRRAGFSRKFDHEPDNLCDYGLGVVIDTETGVTDTLGIVYDREKKESRLSPDCGFMPELPGFAADSPEYLKFVKEQARSDNPVLRDMGFAGRMQAKGYNIKRYMRKYLGGAAGLFSALK